MCLKIRCDGESEKFCKFFWKLNKARHIDDDLMLLLLPALDLAQLAVARGPVAWRPPRVRPNGAVSE